MLLALLIFALQTSEDTTIKSTVVVDGKAVTVAKPAPQGATGTTVDPVQETAERAVRRDAVEARESQRFRSSGLRQQPVEATAVVGTVVSIKKGPSETSCVQVGVVGKRANCRPVKPGSQ